MRSANANTPRAIARWHELAASRDSSGLDALLADDVVFHSPLVHTPQRGKPITKMYLSSAMNVLGGEQFRYVGEWIGEHSAVLEFKTAIEGIEIDGVDIIGWNGAGEIDSFKVMVRPLKAIQILHQKMGAMLAAMQQQQ